VTAARRRAAARPAAALPLAALLLAALLLAALPLARLLLAALPLAPLLLAPLPLAPLPLARCRSPRCYSPRCRSPRCRDAALSRRKIADARGRFAGGHPPRVLRQSSRCPILGDLLARDLPFRVLQSGSAAELAPRGCPTGSASAG
jgi:hypothetical protein